MFRLLAIIRDYVMQLRNAALSMRFPSYRILLRAGKNLGLKSF